MGDRVITGVMELLDVLRNGVVSPAENERWHRFGVHHVEHTVDDVEWWISFTPPGLRDLAAAATELADRIEAEAADG